MDTSIVNESLLSNIANVASTNLQTHINCLFALYRYRLPELLVEALPSLNHNQ